jgi:hypothetical protein
MKDPQQGRALTTGRHIAAAKVGDHANARHFGQRIRITDLPSKGRRQVRAMAQSLAVTADGGYLPDIDACASQQRQRRQRKNFPQLDVDLTHLIQRNATSPVDERRNPALQVGFERRGAGCNDPQRFRTKIDQRRIDGIHAGPGNQAKIKPHKRGS